MTAPLKSRRWTLARRPTGAPGPDDFRFEETELPAPESGDVAVEVLYVSVDPYIRGRMRNVRSYVAPLEIGDVIDGEGAGRVVHSEDPRFWPGDFVAGRFGWQSHAVVQGHLLRKLPADPALLTVSLGVLGMTGLTAYFGLLDIGRPKEGETVLVSGAAGAVGMVVGQIAKIQKCRAVGIVGSDEKAAFLRELGFDAAVNYKSKTPLKKALREACPSGVDIYFDNVGGEVSDTALTLINNHARIPICGQISLYNRERTEMGPRNLLYLVVFRARMEGFLVMDYKDRYPEALAELERWYRESRLKNRESVVNGLERAPDAFLGLFRGDNLGKQLVKVGTV